MDQYVYNKKSGFKEMLLLNQHLFISRCNGSANERPHSCIGNLQKETAAFIIIFYLLNMLQVHKDIVF